MRLIVADAYGNNGGEVVVPTGSTYQVEYDTPDVVDVRTAEALALLGIV